MRKSVGRIISRLQGNISLPSYFGNFFVEGVFMSNQNPNQANEKSRQNKQNQQNAQNRQNRQNPQNKKNDQFSDCCNNRNGQ